MQQTIEPTRTSRQTPSPIQRETIHDLRNLFAIVSSAKHLLDGQPSKVRRLALLQAIEASAIRGGALTTSLLALRHPDGVTTRIDLNHQIMTLEPMIRAMSCGVLLDLCDDYLPLRVDADGIDAVIFELLANAKAAGATVVTLRTRRIGARAWLTIQDNGGGMNPETLERVRCCVDLRGAHGAGLSRVETFARTAHAQLHFRSRAGIGTVVSMNLPTVLRMAASEPGADVPRISLTMKEKSREKNRRTSPA